jgi:hypothetical protein
VLSTQLIEVAQSLSGEEPNLWIVALLLEFRDNDYRQNDRMFRKAEHGLRVTQ